MALVDREEQDGAANIRREVGHFIPLFRRSDFEGTADAPGDRAATRSGAALDQRDLALGRLRS